jgi:hypothetical protein
MKVVTEKKCSTLHAGFGFLNQYTVAPEVDDVMVYSYVASAVRAVSAAVTLWFGLSS